METKFYLGIELKLADFKPVHWLFHENEWWKPVVDYEDYYEVSSLGKVRSFDRIVKGNWGHHIKRKRQIIKSRNSQGYKAVNLNKEGVEKTIRIHVLQMNTFFGKSELITNHKDFNRSNNRITNLERCTQRQNVNHYFNTTKTNSGHRCILYNHSRKRWYMVIRVLGKRIKFGYFIELEHLVLMKEKYYDKISNAKTLEEVYLIREEILDYRLTVTDTTPFTCRINANYRNKWQAKL